MSHACIVILFSFPFLQVVEMCWSQHLHDAMIHVYNSGMNDYTTPLLELLLQLRVTLKKADGKPISGKMKMQKKSKLLELYFP